MCRINVGRADEGNLLILLILTIARRYENGRIHRNRMKVSAGGAEIGARGARPPRSCESRESPAATARAGNLSYPSIRRKT